jgi:Rod binding domain-containing protein
MSDVQISKLSSGQDLNSARSLQEVRSLRGAGVPGANSTKIDKAARSFESLLVGHWLEQAEKSFASVPGTDPDEQSDSSRDQFMSIACESLAKGLSKNSGFGIAAMISKNLKIAAESASKPESQISETPLSGQADVRNSSSIK